MYCKDSDLAGRGDGFVEITCSDPAAFRTWPARDIFRMVDALAAAKAQVDAGTLTTVKFREMEQMIGINHVPSGLLADRSLRPHLDPVAVCTYDWVHTLL